MTISTNTNKVTTYEFSFTDQDIEALKRVYELFESIDNEIIPNFIEVPEKAGIDVNVFSQACETITNLLNFHTWKEV